jgi:hypothetical protein
MTQLKEPVTSGFGTLLPQNRCDQVAWLRRKVRQVWVGE